MSGTTFGRTGRRVRGGRVIHYQVPDYLDLETFRATGLADDSSIIHWFLMLRALSARKSKAGY